MIGAILGDLIGTPHEGALYESGMGELFSSESDFSDDTVLTCAVADAILHKKDYAKTLREWTKRYPNRGYGERYYAWAIDDTAPNGTSWSNGATMRISPLSMLCSDEERSVVAMCVTNTSHDHEQSYNWVMALLHMMNVAKKTRSPDALLSEANKHNLDLRRVSELLQDQYYESSCEDTVPKALSAAIDANCFEDVMRNCIRIGGDVDTIAAMAGGLAEFLYGIPKDYIERGWDKLPEEMRSIILLEYGASRIDEIIELLKPRHENAAGSAYADEEQNAIVQKSFLQSVWDFIKF